MTNYNDGKWHGWDGGECPVHPKTVVDAMTMLVWLPCSVASSIGGWEMPHDNPIIAFRVVKEYREPRECWAVGKHMHDSLAKAEEFRAQVDAANPGRGHLATPITHWREVVD